MSYADLVKKEEEAEHAAPGVVSSPSSSFIEPREGQPPLKKLKQGSFLLDRLSAAANSELQMDFAEDTRIFTDGRTASRVYVAATATDTLAGAVGGWQLRSAPCQFL